MFSLELQKISQKLKAGMKVV